MWSLVSDLLWVLQLLKAVCSSSFLWMIFAVSARQLHVNENTNLATHDSFRNIWHTWKSVSLPLDFRITSFYNFFEPKLKDSHFCFGTSYFKLRQKKLCYLCFAPILLPSRVCSNVYSYVWFWLCWGIVQVILYYVQRLINYFSFNVTR